MLKLIIIFLSLITASCQSKINNNINFYKKLHYTEQFIITSYLKNNFDKTKPIYIYLEGDGQAWVTRNRLSTNPTPRNPLTLKLAYLDKHTNVAYIARPCQFTPLKLDRNCHPKYWSSARYSKPVIDAINQTIDNIKNLITSNNREIHLIGYSGGATIAGIIAATRNDIKSLTTIAGNLDHDEISKYHNTSLLTESLNLVNFTEKISHIPQIHYLGSKDQIIPVFITKNFVNRINKLNNNIAKYIILENIDHYSGWLEFWQTKNS